jgi:hypothetical protein
MRFGYVFLYQVCVKCRERGLLYLPFKFAERWITKCVFFTGRVGPVHLKCALTNIGTLLLRS